MHVMRLMILVATLAVPLHGAEMERPVTVDWEGALEDGAIVRIVGAFTQERLDVDAGPPGPPGPPVITTFGRADESQRETNADRPQDDPGAPPAAELRVHLGDAADFADCDRRVEQAEVRRDGDDVLFSLLLDAFTTSDTVTVYLFVNDAIHAQVEEVYLGEDRPNPQAGGETESDEGPPGPPQNLRLSLER